MSKSCRRRLKGRFAALLNFVLSTASLTSGTFPPESLRAPYSIRGRPLAHATRFAPASGEDSVQNHPADRLGRVPPTHLEVFGQWPDYTFFMTWRHRWQNPQEQYRTQSSNI